MRVKRVIAIVLLRWMFRALGPGSLRYMEAITADGKIPATTLPDHPFPLQAGETQGGMR
jgi:hypothetical protein